MYCLACNIIFTSLGSLCISDKSVDKLKHVSLAAQTYGQAYAWMVYVLALC